jgi:hypothetical protein
MSKKNKKEKIEVEIKTGLLDEEVSLAIVAKFSIVEIRMKNDWRWKVKMLVHEILPKTHHDYRVKLEFDDEPYLKTIAQLEDDAAKLARDKSLFPDVDKRSIKEIDDRIQNEKKQMEKMRSECPNIEFVTQTEEIKYKDGDTALIFKVLDTVIQPLNEQKYRLSEYRAVLDPIF